MKSRDICHQSNNSEHVLYRPLTSLNPFNPFIKQKKANFPHKKANGKN